MIGIRLLRMLVMPTTLPNNNRGGYRRQSAGVAIESGLLAASLLVAFAFCVTTSVLPADLVLPALSVIVVVSGLLLGAFTLLRGRSRGHQSVGMLDVAGVLVLFGFATAIICDKTEALSLLAALPAL